MLKYIPASPARLAVARYRSNLTMRRVMAIIRTVDWLAIVPLSAVLPHPPVAVRVHRGRAY